MRPSRTNGGGKMASVRRGVAAKGPLPEGIPGFNTGYWAGKSIG